MKIKQLASLFIVLIVMQSCDYFSDPNDKMIKILAARKKMYDVKDNAFSSKTEVAYYDSIINSSDEGFFKLSNELNKGNALLKLGKEAESVAVIENSISRMKKLGANDDPKSLQSLGIAYMRLGEIVYYAHRKKRNSYHKTRFSKSNRSL
jgi:hypothetical protein